MSGVVEFPIKHEVKLSAVLYAGNKTTTQVP